MYSPDEINAWGTSIKFSDFEIWLSAIVRYIKMYPLILACSFVNQSGKVPYKQEYIIPQMLMQWVQRNSDFAQGISYFTCTDTTTQTSMWCAYNIVIPDSRHLMPKNISRHYVNIFVGHYLNILLLLLQTLKETKMTEDLYMIFLVIFEVQQECIFSQPHSTII